MKALITGGAGFIGSHLAEMLLATGQGVIAIDDLSTGSEANIEHLARRDNFEFVHDDVRNAKTMHVLVEKCDVVYHLAAAVGVQLIVDQPVRTIETNIHGSEVVLNIANKFRKKVLLASTSEVYGKSENVPFKEDDDTVMGSTKFSRWSYACSKAIDEFLALAYFQQFDLPVIVARFFNTIGPRQSGQYGMVVPRFVERALNNESLLVYGTGAQARCFAYVGDVVGAVIKLMNCPEAPGRVYNIGSREEITIEALANKIIAMTDSRSEIRHLSYEQAYGKAFDDLMRRIPCLDRIGQTIGYKPTTTLEQTLQSIIEDIRAKRDA
jgi:UDP-glucose 4-epimerase